MFDSFIHRFLRVPYTLYVRADRRVHNARETVVLIHGLGDTGALWSKLIKELPKDVNYIVIDLLGFGESPHPEWAKYEARMQARSIMKTCLQMGMTGPFTFVGHSLGSLVAVEAALHYDLFTKRLILCAPPIYNKPLESTFPKQMDDVLRSIYMEAAKQPSSLIDAYGMGQKLRFLSPSLKVTEDTVNAFMQSLHSSIINQHTIEDLTKIKKPITIINGMLDPFVIRGNLAAIAKTRANITLVDIPAAHMITNAYRKQILKLI